MDLSRFLKIVKTCKYMHFHVNFFRRTHLIYHIDRLELALRKFTVVFEGSSITLTYGGTQYSFEVVSVQPAKACCIVDADLEVEFEISEELQAKLNQATKFETDEEQTRI